MENKRARVKAALPITHVVKAFCSLAGLLLVGCASSTPREFDRLPLFGSSVPSEVSQQVANRPCVPQIQWEENRASDHLGFLFELRRKDGASLVVNKRMDEFGPEESAAVLAKLQEEDSRQVAACLRIRQGKENACDERNSRRDRYFAIVSLESVMREIELPIWQRFPAQFPTSEARVGWINRLSLHSQVHCGISNDPGVEK